MTDVAKGKTRKELHEEFASDTAGLFRALLAESDRGCILLGAAELDLNLKSLIAKFFELHGPEDGEVESKKLLNGSLKSFEAKSQAAYCLGLISKTVKHDFTKLGEIRNDFAHYLHNLSFGESETINRCKQLSWFKVLTAKKLMPHHIDPYRWIYMYTVAERNERLRLTKMVMAEPTLFKKATFTEPLVSGLAIADQVWPDLEAGVSMFNGELSHLLAEILGLSKAHE
jgi:DNA-binding MltR family transcriptional regulator